jgi:hypothetical protein
VSAISPDVPAWLAYLVVFAGGLVTAITNVRRLVGEHPGYWRMPRTWLLFFLYLFFPLVLYWVLDRLGALHDTSLVAALLVGFAYQQIMTGGVSVIRVPGSASQFWQPFQTIAQGLAERIAKQWRVQLERIYDRMHVVLSNEEKISAVTDLAFEKSDDPAQLKSDLDQIDQLDTVTGQHVSGTRLDDLKRRKKVERLLRELRRSAPEHWGDLLRDKGIINRSQHFGWVRHGWGGLFAVSGLLLVAVTVGMGVYRFFQHDYQDVYYRWRLTKANATVWDRYRTWRYFAEHDDAVDGTLIVGPLGLLESNALPPGAIDEIFRVLTFVQRHPIDSTTARTLIGALRTADAGVRLRVHQQLLLAAQSHPVPLTDSVLLRWVPSEKDTPAEISMIIRRWTAWLNEASRSAGRPVQPNTTGAGARSEDT